MVLYLVARSKIGLTTKAQSGKLTSILLDSYSMLTIKTDPLPISFDTDLFNIKVFTSSKRLSILMVLNIDDVTTKGLPQTAPILQTLLPSINQHKCFNNYHLPFSEELKNTEMGHLFEHILLEYLSLMKLENGCKDVCFEGETSWDWHKEDRGIFHIDIKLSPEDMALVYQAIQKSIDLLNIILFSKYSLAEDSSVNMPQT